MKRQLEDDKPKAVASPGLSTALNKRLSLQTDENDRVRAPNPPRRPRPVTIALLPVRRNPLQALGATPDSGGFTVPLPRRVLSRSRLQAGTVSALQALTGNVSTAPGHEAGSNCIIDNGIDLKMDHQPELLLPTVQDSEHPDLHMITPATLAMALARRPAGCARIRVFDCRYGFEYDGGHIDGAINVCDKEALLEHLSSPAFPCAGQADAEIIVFHCEYSSQRAPRMARELRQVDRNFNRRAYPSLSFPQVFVLQGGYRAFFSMHRSRCQPQEYVMMHDTRFKVECAEAMKRSRRQRLRSRQRSRSATQSAREMRRSNPAVTCRLDFSHLK